MPEPLLITSPQIVTVDHGDFITITATITYGELYYDMTTSFDDSVGVAADTINEVESTMTMSSIQIAQELGGDLGLSVGWALAGDNILGGVLVTAIITILLGMFFVGLVKVILAAVSYLWRLIKVW